MTHLIRRFAGTFQLLFVVAVVGGAMLLSVALKPDQAVSYPAPESMPVAVSLVSPETASFRPTVELNGIVEARTITDVIPQVSGRVIAVSPDFRPGARIAEGDVMFRIDPADYELAVERTLAEIEAARSELALLDAQATAEKKVWAQQSPDRKIPDLIARVPQIAAAKARIQSAMAARDAAELALQRTVVRTPFDSRVLNTRLAVGQVVNTGVVVGSVFSVDSLEVAVPISLQELALLGDPIGQAAEISSEAARSVQTSGKVVRKAASLDERTRLGALYISADDTASLILGEFVAVRIEGQNAAQSFRIPAAALTSGDQIWVAKNGQLEERRIEVLGSENELLVVKEFDFADGIVTVPPADARAGLAVTERNESKLASTSVSGATGARP